MGLLQAGPPGPTAGAPAERPFGPLLARAHGEEKQFALIPVPFIYAIPGPPVALGTGDGGPGVPARRPLCRQARRGQQIGVPPV